MKSTNQIAVLSAKQTEALTRIWEKTVGNKAGLNHSWDADLRTVYELGFGMQELLQRLYREQPSLSAFLRWADGNRISTIPETKGTPDTLDAEDLAHWNEKGFVIIRDAVSNEVGTAAANAIWQHLQASPHEPDSWYRRHPDQSGMMLTLTQHPALWEVRRSPRIQRAFEQLYGTTALYPVVDKVSFNPPEAASYSFLGSALHWDTSLTLPIPLRLQGLLYLTETSDEDGAFHCVPGFHNKLESWLNSLPSASNARELAPRMLQPEAVPGKAGDFIIWHSALPHCASPNRGRLPRLVQYHTYLPEGFEDKRPWL